MHRHAHCVGTKSTTCRRLHLKSPVDHVPPNSRSTLPIYLGDSRKPRTPRRLGNLVNQATMSTRSTTHLVDQLQVDQYTCHPTTPSRLPLFGVTQVDALHWSTSQVDQPKSAALLTLGPEVSSAQARTGPTTTSVDSSQLHLRTSPTSCMGLVLGGRGPFVLTVHEDASWVDNLATQRSSQGYTFSLGSGSVSWWSTRSFSVLSSSCEAEIYAGAMAVQELRWLTYLLTDLGERPHSSPVLYVNNKAMIALCQEHRLEHRTKHNALRYFLAREMQQRGQLRLAYVAS
ncbi:unnamed protein product [Closterium sp. NIES-53]